MQDPLKYTALERERRFRVEAVPDGVVAVRQITDHYLDGTRLRLREMTDAEGRVTRKLGHKVRLGSGPEEIPYDEAEARFDEALHIAVPRRR